MKKYEAPQAQIVSFANDYVSTGNGNPHAKAGGEWCPISNPSGKNSVELDS